MTTTNQEHGEVSATTVRGTGEERRVRGIHGAPGLHWVGDGFRVHGYFGAIPEAARRLDPFLLLDYHPPYEYPPTDQPRGVGVHPHRGFETVTIAWEGSVAHHDSSGGGGVIGPGDVQWMTAASGILHREYHEAEFARRGGPFHMAQLWVNLPRKHKMSAPRYQSITSGSIGVVELPGDAGQVRVIAGDYQGTRGPAETFSPVEIYDARLRSGGTARFDAPARHNLGLLVMKGSIRLGSGETAKLHDFVVFANTGDHVTVTATEDAHLLVLGGEPIGEPIVQYGPFVMNTKREILEAVQDFESGKFGRLE